MCGIFSYLGNRKNAGKLVVDGLKKLEYRGYDSFGFVESVPSISSGQENRKLKLTKKIGKISEFPLSTPKDIRVKPAPAIVLISSSSMMFALAMPSHVNFSPLL